MEFKATEEQAAIIHADLVPQCVIACAGSGKTATAVRRLIEIRRRLPNTQGYVLLLSFSNVAVSTFEKEYADLVHEGSDMPARVTIDTVDSFLTRYILRPHGARVMRAQRQPFLVSGSETFLNGYKVYDGNFSRDIKYLTVRLRDTGIFTYFICQNSVEIEVDAKVAERTIERLGQVGGYTHELGRYWALRSLVKEPKLLNALARRFPAIIVDEAQDIGSLHWTLLGLLKDAGATVSLIGDPNQAIFEFADADGGFLREYEKEPGVKAFSLTQNRRSLTSIVSVANAMAGTRSTAFRTAGNRRNGAYYLRYDPNNVSAALALFEQVLRGSGYGPRESIVLCRGRSHKGVLSGACQASGSGATEFFAAAAVLRDASGDIGSAFEQTISGVLRLLDKASLGLRNEVLGEPASSDAKTLRRLLWRFLRHSDSGLPPAGYKATVHWFPCLKRNLQRLLSEIEAITSLRRSPSWANNVTKRNLADVPLWEADLFGETSVGARIDTIHKAKGEGFCAVIYAALPADVSAFVGGVGNEEGRIGYVALTRAKDLFVLAVPMKTKQQSIAALESKGMVPWNF